MNNKRHQLVDIITNNNEYKEMCSCINTKYAEDIYQEVIIEILTISPARLPDTTYLKFWFYRVAFNINSRNGKLGKIIHKDIYNFSSDNDTSEATSENLIKEAEKFMLSLSEFENRIVLLYYEYGDMKKVQRLTGISYSALRSVKEKLKLKAKDL